MKNAFLQSPIEIPYRFYPNSGKILWPIIKIQLSTKSSSLPGSIFALIDSGASHSLLHPLVAEMLGFDLKKQGKAKVSGTSASGEYKSWILPRQITIDAYGFTFQRTFIVIDNSEFLWPCILGGDSIFEIAKLNFIKFKGYFEIQFRKDLH